MTRFDLSLTPHTKDHADDFGKIAACIERLAARRKSKIERTGPLLKSKLAWKVATYQESILYRVVALAEGARLAWNASNVLTSFLAVRALVETIAVFDELESSLLKNLEKEDLAALDALIMNRSFATRDEELLKVHNHLQAISVLTFINKLEKRYNLPIRSNYDSMSERCHPNSAGHHQMFSKTDYDTATVTFSNFRTELRYIDFIRAPLGLLFIFENGMKVLDDAVLKLAELHHRVHPNPDIEGLA